MMIRNQSKSVEFHEDAKGFQLGCLEIGDAMRLKFLQYIGFLGAQVLVDLWEGLWEHCIGFDFFLGSVVSLGLGEWNPNYKTLRVLIHSFLYEFNI